MRKLKTELPSTSADFSRSSASNSQHRHTNHDRKHGHEKREHDERKDEIDRRDHADRRDLHTHSDRKEIGPTGDGHPVTQPKREPHAERRDIAERREERKDINDRRNAEIKGAHEKKDSLERKVTDIRKETSVSKDHAGKVNVHKKDGEKKEFVPGKDPHKYRHERNFLDAVNNKDCTDSHVSISEKQESKNLPGDRKESGVHNSGHIPRTSLTSQNVKSENIKSETHSMKTESDAPDQTSAKPEFVVPKSEKLETHPHLIELPNTSVSGSNAAPNIVPVSLNLSPAMESLKSGLHKSKSEITLNYKDYLQRKERERQQLLEKQGKFNLNKTFTEGSQSSFKTHQQPNLDTSLPLKLQGNLGTVKGEKDAESRHDIHVKTGQEIEARKRTDHETKMFHDKEVKQRKRSNSKSPGASKRSPRVHNSNGSKVHQSSRGQGHLKSIKTENPQLKLQIPNHSESTLTSPPSPLRSPVKNIKEIPKSEPFVNLGEPLKTDGKKRRFSGPEIEMLTGMELENLKTKTDTIKPESVSIAIPKVTLKLSPAQASVKGETKDITKQSPNVAVEQELTEASATKQSPKITKQEPNETAKQSPVLHDRHPPMVLNVGKQSPVLYNKHPPKDITAAKQSPLLQSKHPPKDLNVAKQSPLVTGKLEYRELNSSKHSPIVAKKDLKESNIAKQNPVVAIQQEGRESNNAKQSPVNVAKQDLKEVKASKQSPRAVLKPESRESNTSKQSPRIVSKQELAENNIDELDIQLKPEHTGFQPLKLHIKELPDVAHDIKASKAITRDVPTTKSESPIPSLKISIKKEPGSGGNTPIKYKTEHSDGNTPLKLTIKQEPSSGSPLKMKLKASQSGDHHSEKHRRHREGHVHSGKHKHKHKSHKHKDRDKDRERKHSKHSVEVPGSNGKQELKIRVKLGQPPSAEGSSSSTAQSGTYHISKHDKHKGKEGANVLPEIAVLNENVNSDEHERHQPWSMSELKAKSAAKAAANSPSRKRRRPPTVDDGGDISVSQPQQKAAKTNSNRLRRSSSSHSVVSMEMSDNECGEDPNKATNEDQLKALQIKLKQAIQFQKRVIDDQLKEQKSMGFSGQKAAQPAYERQKSGFDLDLYCGNSTGTPPLPQGHPPLPPTPPPSQIVGTPPPPPPPPT